MRPVRIVLTAALSLLGLALSSGCSERAPAAVGAAPPGYYGAAAAAEPNQLDRTASEQHQLGSRTDAGAAIIPGQTTPSRDEELWIIAKSPADNVASNALAARGFAGDELPRTGALLTRLPNNSTPIPLPLKHTDVRADITGYVASVAVTQQYHNPFSSKIEAVYVFPLPHNAAVNEFLMTIGDRKIRGVIRERAEAERIYAQAKSQGYVASLLTQERPNIFTQSVANIEPGKQIDIHINYYHTLAYDDGAYEWHFPMVVGPRFNPPAGLLTSVSKSPAPVKNPTYLRPDQRSGHDISLAVHLNAGVKVEELDVPTHRTTSHKEGNLADITLASDDAIPNKDFVLRYRVAGDHLKSALLATRDDRGSYFTLMLYPPASLNNLPRKPLELVYVLDCSGSMEGRPLAQAKAAIRTALTRMGPDDTFQIIKFSNDADLMSPTPLAASRQNIAKALRYLDQPYGGGGGTMMLEGITKSLDFPHDESRLRFVCFLTDGFIGNEAEILGQIHARLGSSRIFSFGVGSSVNRYLLDHMAKMGRGVVAYLDLKQDAEPVMNAFFDRISHPALTDLSIDWGGLHATDVFPADLPDLFVGRPVILTGRFTGNGVASVKIKGKVGNETEAIPLTLNLDTVAGTNPALRPIWARQKIADLADRSTWDTTTDFTTPIRALALEHNLMSPFTAFMAVDATRPTEGAHGTTVAVPVPVPEGTRYETAVTPK